MRSALLPLCSALLASACLWHPYVNGSASYTATPPLADTSGALPLQAVVCRDPDTEVASIRLGDRCTLVGPWANAGRVRGGTARLASTGECALPMAGALTPLRVQTATLEVFGDAVEATVGGTTAEGRYVTYRFTGTTGGDAPKEACADVRAGTQPLNGETLIAPGREAWESSPAEPMGTGGK